MISNCGSDERGKYSDGKAGDQTGREWYIRSWYNHNWKCVIRFPANVREQLALNAEKAAKNDLIGYDQSQRLTYYNHLKASNWDASKITIACEADCSAGVSANIIAAGHKLGIDSLKNFNKSNTTSTLRNACKAVGATILTDSKYLTNDAYLLRGDLILKDGSDTYLRNVQAVKDAVTDYEKILNNLKANPDLVTEENLNKLSEQEKLIKENITAVQNMSAAEKGFTLLSGQKAMDKINSLLKENSAMSREAKSQIRAWYNQIASGNPSKNLSQILGEVQKIVNAEADAGRAGKSMFDSIKEKAWYGVASAIGTYFGFNDILRYGGEAINTIVRLDDALVDLKKTTAMSGSELENFYYDSNDVAKQMGVTTQEVIEQASAWSRLGYSSKEASTEMAKLSSKFAAISPGMSTEDAQSGLVSIMKAFDIDPNNVETEIMDKINTLGNNFAEENQDVVEGLKRSAAAMAAMGQSFTDTAALFTGGMEILQDSESMGTALRTLSMRVRGYDEETNQLSDDLVNVTGEVADLTKTAQDAQGVSLFTDASQEHYRSMVEYLGDIADRWDQISEKNQTEFCLYVQKCA